MKEEQDNKVQGAHYRIKWSAQCRASNQQVKAERGEGNEQHADLGEGHSRKNKQ